MPDPTVLSVIVPCYNEQATLETCVKALLAIGSEHLSLEVLIVDDGSSDESPAIAERLTQQHGPVRCLRARVNRGKGAAVRAGIAAATGDLVAIQDADLEYDPSDLARLIEPLKRGDADVVLGSRFAGGRSPGWHRLGNQALTWLSNRFTGLRLTDMETCYKVFRRDVIQSIDLREDRFGFEPEVIAKVAARGHRVVEAPISYRGRSYSDGKKIGLRDGFRALYCIVRYAAPGSGRQRG